MQLCVLHGDRQLHRERRQKSGFVLRQHAPPGRKDAEQADDVVAGKQGDSDCRLDPRFSRGIAHTRQPRIRGNVLNHEHAA